LESFYDKAVKYGKRKNSRLILALDLFCETGSCNETLRKIVGILEKLSEYATGIKFGLPTILTLQRDVLKEIVDKFKKEFFFIADMKIADIGYVSKILVKIASAIGFDAVISHAIVGYDALKEIVDEAKRHNMGVLTVCAMSHKGAEETINTLFRRNLEISAKAGVDGFILPATMPKYIEEARKIFKKHLVFSPGIGVQGASPGSAIRVGADFEIVGRAIYMSENPLEAARKIVEKLRW